MSDVKAVEIDAEVRQIKTMANGTVNITLNLPEYCLPQAKVLMGWVNDMVRAVIQISGERDGAARER